MKHNPKSLFDAIEAGDKSKVEEILDSKEVDINSKGSVVLKNPDEHAVTFFDITPFMMACALGKFRIAEMLRERGADCKYVNKDGYDALSLACITGSEMQIMYCRIQFGMKIGDKCRRLIALYEHSIDLDEIEKEIEVLYRGGILNLTQLIVDGDYPRSVKYFIHVKDENPTVAKLIDCNLLEFAKQHGRTETVKVMEEYIARSKPKSNITLNDVMQFLTTHINEPSLTISTPNGVYVSFSAAAILDALTPKQKFTSVERTV